MSDVQQPSHRLGCLCEDCLPPVPRRDTRVQILDWRMDQLTEAGYSLGLALTVAESGVDLHYACELVRQVIASGREPALAALIVL